MNNVNRNENNKGDGNPPKRIKTEEKISEDRSEDRKTYDLLTVRTCDNTKDMWIPTGKLSTALLSANGYMIDVNRHKKLAQEVRQLLDSYRHEYLYIKPTHGQLQIENVCNVMVGRLYQD